jgi:hypothetical protein
MVPLHRLQSVALETQDGVAAGRLGVSKQEVSHVHTVNLPVRRNLRPRREQKMSSRCLRSLSRSFCGVLASVELLKNGGGFAYLARGSRMRRGEFSGQTGLSLRETRVCRGLDH